MNTGPFLTLRYILTVCALLASCASFVDQADAAGPVAYRDCALSWNPNTESDLAGYRVYMGRSLNQLNRMRDVGLRTAFRCSEGDAAENGQWFGTVTAYDHSGNESAAAQAVPFEIVGWPDPVLPAEIHEPSSARLVNTTLGAILVWNDANVPSVSHRVEISSSLVPAWTTAVVQPPGVPMFSYFQLAGAEWVCYRVRAERGALVSPWAQAGGPTDRQFCTRPAELPTIAQPILAPTILYEPESVRLAASPRGFTLSWGRPGATTGPAYRIEVSGALDYRWTTLAVLPPGTNEFRYYRAIDAEWACVRIRAEVGRAVSLWSAAGGPTDRQFCFKPSSPVASNP
ncbi:MAG: hypothetical protein Q8N04_16330 [Nitrospira sp.]|nr:hypothetical protein [Nitrospira sp.]